MYRARRLLLEDGKSVTYPYDLLYHHTNLSLLPTRTPGSFAYTLHNVTSAASAIAALLTSQSCRDRFVSLAGRPPWSDAEENNTSSDNKRGDSAIINANVIAQADMGILKTFSLYHGLNNTLYDQSGFDVREFMQGCGWALGQFHRTKDSLLTKMMRDIQEECKDSDENSETTLHLKSSDNFLASLEVAAIEPDSVEADFLSMTTPEMLDTITMEGVMKLVLGNVTGKKDANMPGMEADTQVKNVALISARVEEIYPAPHDDVQKKDKTSDVPLEDVFLTPHRNLRDKDPAAQVVAQLEVLYELQRSFIDDDEKSHEQTSLLVGKFETCIAGDPNNEQEMQWRLCSYRPATEFGYYNSW